MRIWCELQYYGHRALLTPQYQEKPILFVICPVSYEAIRLWCNKFETHRGHSQLNNLKRQVLNGQALWPRVSTALFHPFRHRLLT
jgi:hypothetical protein